MFSRSCASDGPVVVEREVVMEVIVERQSALDVHKAQV